MPQQPRLQRTISIRSAAFHAVYTLEGSCPRCSDVADYIIHSRRVQKVSPGCRCRRALGCLDGKAFFTRKQIASTKVFLRQRTENQRPGENQENECPIFRIREQRIQFSVYALRNNLNHVHTRIIVHLSDSVKCEDEFNLAMIKAFRNKFKLDVAFITMYYHT